MRIRNKLLWTLIILIIALFGFAKRYQNEYSMDIVSSFEVNSPSLEGRLLIVTQGSEFKDAVVKGIVAQFKSRSVYIKVSDIADLSMIKVEDWDAIALIHTWEMWKPPLAVQSFFDSHPATDKLVVLTTSGDGVYHMEEVDAITGASLMKDVPSTILKMNARIDKLLNK